MLTKDTAVTMSVLEDGSIQIQEATYILEDGKRIAGPTYHRSTLRPGEATGGKTARVAAVAAAVWTPDVIAAEEEKKSDDSPEDVKGA